MRNGAELLVVLIVDDSDVCADTLAVALESAPGMRTVVVHTAEAALGWIGEGGVGALITDVQLEGMSGLDLVEKLRAGNGVSGIPVVVVSGAPDPSMEKQARAAGANAFFRKPYSPGEVRRELERLLA